MKLSVMKLLATVLLMLLAAPTALVGQTVSTEMLGLVTDTTGAVIPGATITAKRTATGDTHVFKTNETGNYLIPFLEPGEYEVSCSAPGFKTEVRRGIVLQLQQKARLDFQLQVGVVAETVEVQATAPLLRTEDAALGLVVESKRVVDLPLNGRNFAQLATLMPGVVFGVSRMGLNGQGGFPIPGQMVAISANGQRDINQQITLDGVIATEPRVNTMTFTPSIEAIEEFKVQSAVYSAEYGMNSGAQVSVALKSGTNNFHGTLFEFLRNNLLDARGFFLPPNQPKNKLRRNQYGAVASGPIVKDRTFWLFNWEARRERRGTPSVAAVPTVAMRNGDFAEILRPRNRWYPADANPAVTRQIFIPGTNAPLPNNIIPPNLINPVSRNLLTAKKGSPLPEGGFFRLPNLDDQARARNSPINLAGTNDRTIDSDQFIGRIDHRFSDKDRIFGRYVIVDASFDDNPLLRVTRLTSTNRSQNLGSQWVRTISPTVLNEFRYGYNRSTDDIAGIHTNTDFTQRDVGLDFRVVGDNNRTLRKDEEGLPAISIAGFAGLPLSSNAGWFNVHYVHHFADSVSISKGRHNFKFGGEYRYNFLDRGAANLPRGRMSFTRDIQGIPDGFAAFVLGFPNTAETAEGVPPLFARQNRYGFYALDDWKATSKLNLNLGIRYDLFTSVQDAKGKFRNLDFSRGVTIGGIFAPMLWPNPDVQAALYDIPLLQFMPRIGIAYRLRPTWVVRTGAGQFYNVQQINNFSILNLQPPFSGSNLFQNDRVRPQATIDNPFAGSATTRPTALLMLGNIQKNGRSLYLNNDVWQWTLEIEKSVGQNFVAAVGYVGSKGSNIDITISNWNNPDPGPGDIQARRPIQFYVDSREPNKLLPLSTVRRLDTSQNSWYHALQLRAEKRYSKGLTFVASYNLQKALAFGYGANEGAGFNDNVPQDPRNIRQSKGRSNIDQRHRLVFSHIYELPFFRNAPGAKGILLGGWAINGIIQLTSGLPVTVTQTGDRHNTGAASSPRPHLVPGQKVRLDNRSVDRWFNTNAFQFSVQQYGNAGVGLFDAPAQKTWDFALFKEFRVREGHRIQFRYEVFNLLNTPQFSAPDRSLGSATFGRITSTLSDNREMQFGLKYIF